MTRAAIIVVAALAFVSSGAAAREDGFNVLQHLGGNGQWFPGPGVTGISSETPSGCTVDLFAFFSRHGSRYPDSGAYNEWTNLSSRIQAAGPLTIKSSALSFLSSWTPALDHPDQQIAQVSPTGYKELYDMGATYRLRYADLYEYNTPLTLWANYYSSSPRVRDSARLFARGFLGPNATDLGTIYALNSTSPSSFLNSLAPSDLCPAYKDSGGSPYIDTWNNIYLPPIQKRLNAQIKGGFAFTQEDVSIISYLCGFESQITGKRSPWCGIFTESEVLQYEYAQDLRYWYGNGLGTDVEKDMMLPVLEGVVQRFIDGPNASYTNANGSTFTPPKILSSFTNDGQINQLVAATGLFDAEPQLPVPKNGIPPHRRFVASRIVPMRGTVAFERLSCSSSASGSGRGNEYKRGNGEGNGTYVRILLNDVVYPVAGCTSGPGSSCPLTQYEGIVKRKVNEVGDFRKLCNVTDPAVPMRNDSAVTFFRDVDLSFATVVKP